MVRLGLAVAGFSAAVAWVVAVLSGGESVLQPVFDALSAHWLAALVGLASFAALLWALFPLRPADSSVAAVVREEPVPVG
jgi:hypothetical protein